MVFQGSKLLKNSSDGGKGIITIKGIDDGVRPFHKLE
jgi:hypothetical protein